MGFGVKISSAKSVLEKARISMPREIKPAQAEKSIGEMLGGADKSRTKKISHLHISPKYLKMQKIAQKFSTIFRRDISVEESEKMLQTYKDLLKIKDRDTFIQEAFKQVKKDYGYAGKDIKFKIADQKGGSFAWWPSLCNVSMDPILFEYVYKSKKLNYYEQIGILSSFMHELQHAKQSEFGFRANSARYMEHIFSNKDAYENAIYWLEEVPKAKKVIKRMLHGNNKFHFKSGKESEEFLNNALKKLKSGNYESDESVMNLLEMLKTDQRSRVQKIFGSFEGFEPNSKNYNLGIKYLENEENYVPIGPKTRRKYKKQLIEQEAYSVQNDFNKILTKSLTPKERLQIKLQKIMKQIHMLTLNKTRIIEIPNSTLQNS